MPVSPAINRRYSIVAILILIVLGGLIYIFSLPNAMFWDDEDFILKNVFLRDWHDFPRFFSENVIAGSHLLSNYWRPLLLTVFSAEWHLWHGRPAGWHLVNFGVHLADSILLFFLIRRLFGLPRLAFLVSLLFLIHPIQTEAVVYINSLGDPLSVLFVFAGLIFYHRSRTSNNENDYALSMFMYILGLLSKETAFMMPSLLFLVEFFLLDPGLSTRQKWKQILRWLWPFILMAGIYLGLRATVLNFNGTFNFYKEPDLFSTNWAIRLFTFFRVLTVYLGLLIWPIHLHVERSVPIATSIFRTDVFLGCLVFFGALIAIFRLGRKRPLINFSLGWFFLTLLPASNLFIPINALLYEHWLYVPMIGFLLPLLGEGLKLAERYHLKVILCVCFLLSAFSFSFLSIQRILEWRDPIRFYELTLEYAPKSYRVINNLGMAYADRGFLDKAQAAYERAISIDPSNPVAHHNIGNLFLAQNRLEAARKEYETAIRVDPKFLFTYPYLANLYLRTNDYPSARRTLEKLFPYSQDPLGTLQTLFDIALQEKNYPAAFTYITRALALSPHNWMIQKSFQELQMRVNPSTSPASLSPPSTIPR